MAIKRIHIINKGISPILGELIIVGIAIALAVSILGYVYGWFEQSSGHIEGLKVYPDGVLIIDQRNDIVYASIHVYSDFKPNVEITNIVLGKYKFSRIEINEIISGDAWINSKGHLVLNQGTELIFVVYFDNVPLNYIKPSFMDRIEVYIITNNGFVYKAVLKIINNK